MYKKYQEENEIMPFFKIPAALGSPGSTSPPGALPPDAAAVALAVQLPVNPVGSGLWLVDDLRIGTGCLTDCPLAVGPPAALGGTLPKGVVVDNESIDSVLLL